LTFPSIPGKFRPEQLRHPPLRPATNEGTMPGTSAFLESSLAQNADIL